MAQSITVYLNSMPAQTPYGNALWGHGSVRSTQPALVLFRLMSWFLLIRRPATLS